MKILFIGTVKSSEFFLKKLIQMKVEIVGVVTKSESAYNSDYCDLTGMCYEEDIDFITVDDVNNEDCIKFIEKKVPDLIYCFGWSQILKKELLEIPRIGVVGYHPALIPFNRGRHPIIWALVLGLVETASTFFWIDEGVDTGDIISQVKVEIDYEDDALSLYRKLLEIGVKQIEIFTKQIKLGKLERLPQCDSGNEWRKRSKKDGAIDWRMSSFAIYNLVRGLTSPYVGAHFDYRGKEIKVWKVKEVEDNKYINIEPGKVIKTFSKTSFLVKAGENLIEVLVCDQVSLKEGEYI